MLFVPLQGSAAFRLHGLVEHPGGRQSQNLGTHRCDQILVDRKLKTWAVAVSVCDRVCGGMHMRPSANERTSVRCFAGIKKMLPRLEDYLQPA